jgi:radical SAM protein with 4Fe4S-binding SPASM domain
MQWHLTERCNLRCSHCYQDDNATPEATFADWLRILEQFKAFAAPGAARRQVTLTGGEPLAHRDFARLMERLAADASLSVAVLTNGTLIDADMARRLRAWRPRFVQVSLDGDRATHDRIRGAGAFDRAVTGLECLVREDIPAFIAFTAHRDNFREFRAVARLGRELGVRRVWADRLIPLGRGAALDGPSLTAAETREFVELLGAARAQGAQGRRGPLARPPRTEIAVNRALQFHCGGGSPYHCTAGDTLLAVMPNGDLYPCRRMPIRAGNLLEDPLSQLYDCELFAALRDRTRLATGCESCIYAHLCGGGLRCLAYATTGDPFRADPGCWLASPHISEVD